MVREKITDLSRTDWMYFAVVRVRGIVEFSAIDGRRGCEAGYDSRGAGDETRCEGEEWNGMHDVDEVRFMRRENEDLSCKAVNMYVYQSSKSYTLSTDGDGIE